ncbi:MAG TPA: restriction endonuclease subunit S [Nitrosopumilaceae archaeon]|nr:restriction endonuclease subunit S [Nitrosopumilaceae archaeon]
MKSEFILEDNISVNNSRDWIVKKLGLLGKIVTGKTPPTTHPEYFGSDYPFLTPSDIKDSKFVDIVERGLSKKGLELLENFKIPPSSVTVSCIGSDMGKAVMIKKSCITNQQFNSIIPNELVEPNFLYYSLSNMKNLLKMMAAGGTAQPILNKSDFAEIPILIPPIEIQKKISLILSGLDDIIELLKKQNFTLEKIIQSIFKSWFIDFGGQIEFVDSELGDIPKGWRVTKIGSELKVITGGTPSRNNQTYWRNGTIPWITSKKTGELRIISPDEYITEEGKERSSTQEIPKRSTVLAIIGNTIGKVSLVEISCCINQNVAAVLCNNEISSEFIYGWIKHMINEITSWKSGGAQASLNQNSIKQSSLLIPDQNSLKKYTETARPIFDLIESNSIMTNKFEKIRDALLPKLISGEIQV